MDRVYYVSLTGDLKEIEGAVAAYDQKTGEHAGYLVMDKNGRPDMFYRNDEIEVIPDGTIFS